MLAVALALTLTGCATNHSTATAGAASVSEAGPIPRGQASITLARTKYYGMAVAVDAEVNGAKFASIDDGARGRQGDVADEIVEAITRFEC